MPAAIQIAPTPTMVAVNGRKCGVPRGTVTIDGRTIGWAVRKSRVAAGSAPGRRQTERRAFYTATPYIPHAPGDPYSGGLGTRYPTRTAAIRALRAFDRWLDGRPATWDLAAAFVKDYPRGF